jgi:hypothetical protein
MIMPASGVALYELWKYRQQVIVKLLENLSMSLTMESFRSEICQVLCDLGREETTQIPPLLGESLDSVLENPACASVKSQALFLSLSAAFGLFYFQVTFFPSFLTPLSRVSHCFASWLLLSIFQNIMYLSKNLSRHL